jgi:predicted CXXCH cytochrome family protein
MIKKAYCLFLFLLLLLAQFSVSLAAEPIHPKIKYCAQCHADVVKVYSKSAHGRGLILSGLPMSAVCTSCHLSHKVPDEQEIPRICGKCHTGVIKTWSQSTHGQLWQSGGGGPVCTTCHGAHKLQEPWLKGFRVSLPQTCGGCHEEKAKLYQDTFHGQATSLGFIAAATCSDCHTPHSNFPQSDPRSSIHKNNLIKTCGRCHPKANANFVSFDPHADPAAREKNPAIHYTYLFMNLLLFGTFGFFGLHTLLWLQRSIVGALGNEFKRPPEDERYISRFSLPERLTHITIIVSFLMLAATGLPLKYHFAPWAGVLAGLLGGLETTRYFHKVFALVTFGYAAYHLLSLRGWSMVPNLKDLKDLWSNLKWFLYLGPRPRLDRFTYWEKFDYLAIFWGIPIIGLSGLMIWAKEFFSGFVPGWVLNVAFLIHSDEALLAVGFIFIIHFFHSHLRPENFPLDPVIFTGRLSLSRFRDERPLEYERLLQTGRLEIVEKPSKEMMLFARFFGGAAVAVGAILILGILLSLFSH